MRIDENRRTAVDRGVWVDEDRGTDVAPVGAGAGSAQPVHEQE
jgi:hypothetical protein